jgi:hypothetical protein
MTIETRSLAGRIELATGVVVLTAILGVALALAARWNTPVEPGLVVEKLEFGPVWEQPAHRHVLVLSNVTNRPVPVADFATGCSCTRVEPHNPSDFLRWATPHPCSESPASMMMLASHFRFRFLGQKGRGAC